MRALRMDDEHPDQAHHFLHRHMRVVEERSVLMQRELVHKLSARRDQILRDAGHAVHLVRDLQTVPVHRKALGQSIFDDESDPIAFVDLNRRARNAAVESPCIDRPAGHEFRADVLGCNLEHFHAVFEAPWHVGHVRGDDRNNPWAEFVRRDRCRWKQRAGCLFPGRRGMFMLRVRSRCRRRTGDRHQTA